MSTGTRTSRTFAITFLIALVSACSAGGVSTTPQTHPIAPQRKLGWIKTRIFVPRKHHKVLVRGEKKPRFLPAATTQIEFNLQSVDGYTTSYTSFNFKVYVNQTSCTEISGSNPGYECTATSQAPAGTDVFQIVAAVCNGYTSYYGGCPYPETTSALSESLASISVPPGGNASAQFTLNPVVNSLVWSVPTAFSNGGNKPTLSYGYYSCAYAGCYDPIVDEFGNPTIDTVAIEARDASNSVIIPSAGTVYGVPLYLQQNGTADAIFWSCDDASLTLETGGGPFAPGAMMLANGHAGYGPGVNTPVASPAYGATGTDFLGNPVTAVGNNGIQVNYDGVDQPYEYVPFNCQASDSQGNTATYYAGWDLATPSPAPQQANPQVYVGNHTTGLIEFTQNGGYGSPISVSGVDSINSPNGMVVDGGGTAYIADGEQGQVDVIPYGATSVTQTVDGGGEPRAVTVDYFGNLFVADAGSNSVLVYPQYYGGALSSTDAFSLPSGCLPSAITTDPQTDDLYVACGGLNAVLGYAPPYTAGGNTQRMDFTNSIVTPNALAFDVNHHLLYVSTGSNNTVVQIRNANTSPTVWHVITTDIAEPVNLLLDPSFNLYVANFEGSVAEFSYTYPYYGSGSPNTILQSSGSDGPAGLAWDDVDSAVLVAYYNASTVVKYPDLSANPTGTYSAGISNPENVGYYDDQTDLRRAGKSNHGRHRSPLHAPLAVKQIP